MSQLAVHPPAVRRAVHLYKQETTFRRATTAAGVFKRRLDRDVVRNLATLRDMIAHAADFGDQLERPFLRARAQGGAGDPSSAESVSDALRAKPVQQAR